VEPHGCGTETRGCYPASACRCGGRAARRTIPSRPRRNVWYSAGMSSSSGSPERRQSPRVPLADVLAGTLGLTAVVRVVDVSPTGVRIEHAAPLSPGQATVLDVALGGETFHLRTRVAWCHLYQVVTDSAGREIRYRAGLHFIDPPAAGGARLHALLIRPPAPTPPRG
jgi:hypothetical protein